jgi:hypothetical protein
MRTAAAILLLVSALSYAQQVPPDSTPESISQALGGEPSKKQVLNDNATYWWNLADGTRLKCEFEKWTLVKQEIVVPAYVPPPPYIEPCLQEYLAERQDIFERQMVNFSKVASRDRVREKLNEGPNELEFGPMWSYAVGKVGYLPQVEITQVVDEGTALAKDGDVWFFLEGFNFSSAVDGQFSTPRSMVKITGTRQYGTAIGGTNTVYVIEPYKPATAPEE